MFHFHPIVSHIRVHNMRIYSLMETMATLLLALHLTMVAPKIQLTNDTKNNNHLRAVRVIHIIDKTKYTQRHLNTDSY